MLIRYEVTPDDALAFVRLHYERSSAVRRQIRTSQVAGAFLAAIVFAAAGVLSDVDLLLYGAPVAAVVVAVCLPGRLRKAYMRSAGRMYQEGADAGVWGRHEMEVDDTGITDRSEVGHRCTYWRGIERVEETKDHAFVYLGPFTAHVIPRHSVQEGDFDAFVQEVRSRLQDSGA